MPKGTTYELADLRAQGRLEQLLCDWRADGVTYLEITYLLRERHGIRISVATVNRWCRELLSERVA